MPNDTALFYSELFFLIVRKTFENKSISHFKTFSMNKPGKGYASANSWASW